MNDTNKSLLKALNIGPVPVLLLGACPAMAVTTDLRSALAIGLAVMAAVLLSSIVIAAISKLLPQSGRLYVCIAVAAVFVAAIDMLMNAYFPKVYGKLGIYLAVCAVDLLIFAGAENAARSGFKAVADALLASLLFVAVVAVVGAVRELFGAGSIWGVEIAFLKEHAVPALLQAPGGFMIFAFVAAVVNKLVPCSCGQAKGLAAAAVAAADAKAAEKEDA